MKQRKGKMKMLMPKESSLYGRGKREETNDILGFTSLKIMVNSCHIHYGMNMRYLE